MGNITLAVTKQMLGEGDMCKAVACMYKVKHLQGVHGRMGFLYLPAVQKSTACGCPLCALWPAPHSCPPETASGGAGQIEAGRR